jgi:hypothetical protein
MSNEKVLELELDDEQLDVTESAPGITTSANFQSKIQRFDTPANQGTDKQWNRQLKPSGTGAFRVKTFYGRLREEGLDLLDKQINEWFDAHPEYEIKNVTTNIGEMVNYKTTEPALIVNIWM